MPDAPLMRAQNLRRLMLHALYRDRARRHYFSEQRAYERWLIWAEGAYMLLRHAMTRRLLVLLRR